MSEPSAITWKQYSLVGGLGAATVVLLGFIAHALGIIEIRLPGAEDDTATPIGGASPSDIIPDGGSIDSAVSPEDPDTADQGNDGTWAAVYKDQILSLDSFTASTDACESLGFDFDPITPDGPFVIETATIGDSPEHIDLIWDPCTARDDNLVHLASGEASLGSLWVPGTVLDATACHADIYEFGDALSTIIDPESPDSRLTEGLVLCLATSEGQIVIADVASVEPATDEYPGMQATFEVTLWTPA